VKYPPKSAQEVEAFITLLIKRVDMEVAQAPTLLKNPMGYYCEIAGNEGTTGVGILETSHTAVHCWDSEFPAKFQFDLYSCKEFDIERVLALVDCFDIIKGTYLVIDRDTELKVLAQGNIGEGGAILGDTLAPGTIITGPRTTTVF
jgi:S-adenosylmethionine/arginine decarboxylase-like enzyme